MIDRHVIVNVQKALEKGKAAIITGARQIGKSTLLQQMFSDRNDVLWLNGDEYDVREMFQSVTSTRLRAIEAVKREKKKYRCNSIADFEKLGL